MNPKWQNLMMNDRLEVEVKFIVPDLATVRNQLVALGAILENPRIYERNIRFDTPTNDLLNQGKLLRLRQDSRIRITFKGEPPQETQSEVRIREEIELVIDDFDNARTLLNKIGFQPVQVYEKYRETYQVAGVEVVLDEMPFGSFVELEGEEESILMVANQLNLDWSKRILTNYLALMAQLKDHHGLAFDDVTFDNFAGQDWSAADILD